MKRTVELVALDRDTMLALARGDLASAHRTAPVPITPFFANADQRGVWARRAEQIAISAEDEHWVTRVVWDPHLARAVGRAGFHGRPDDRGMAEVGYEIDPDFRGQGYGRMALSALLEWASREPSVLVVRASVSPDNEASLKLVKGFGFVAVDEQWDDEDGLEIVHEVTVIR